MPQRKRFDAAYDFRLLAKHERKPFAIFRKGNMYMCDALRDIHVRRTTFRAVLPCVQALGPILERHEEGFFKPE